MKYCINCQSNKEKSDFHKNKLSHDGLCSACKTCRLSKRKVYYKLNKDKISKQIKEYSIINAEKLKVYRSQYKKDNKGRRSRIEKTRRVNDPVYKLTISIRSRVSQIFRKSTYIKKSKTFEIIGCSYEELKNHIESKFTNWMTWENHGLHNGEFEYGWDIDHIIPLSSAISEEDIYKLNHYTNLQPLCSKINRDIKRDRMDYNPNSAKV